MVEIATHNLRDPARYLPSQDALAAVEVARLLRQPLLITGPPGIGKTSLAEWVAYTMKREFIPFTAKSTTMAGDLLYYFDAVRQFRDIQIAAARKQTEEVPVRKYLRFQALGRAIALTYAASSAEMQAVWDEDTNRRGQNKTSRLHPGGYGSVVLIDEIDKAPRDVPNDLLTEFSNMSFTVNELGQELSVRSELHPMVIATSNSEKALPDAFLRRCIFLNMNSPSSAKLKEIIQSRLPELKDTPAEADAAKMFESIQADSHTSLHLRRKPSTAEFISLLQFAAVLDSRGEFFRRKGLKNGLTGLDDIQLKPRILFQWLSILFKTQDDWHAGHEWLCEHWSLPANEFKLSQQQ